MPCYHPIKGYRSQTVNPSGKRSITFNKKYGYTDMPMEVPCGQCIGCRLERSRQWAMRCVHEASLYEDNCFITLTYDDAHLPDPPTLIKKDFQDFMKRLRKEFDSAIRYFHCGEYGERNCRPHYHACLFNCDFSDKVPLKSLNGNTVYISEQLSKLWPFGYHIIGDVTFESAAYVARYVTKKITGERAEEHYSKINAETGEIIKLQPEYTTMSRHPGIGKDWLGIYESDIYPDDFVIMRDKKLKPPKYYDKLLEKMDPKQYAHIKSKRRVENTDNVDNTMQRLAVREEIQISKFKRLKRSYENEA